MIQINGVTIDLNRLSRNYSVQPLTRGEIPNEKDLKYLYLELNLTQQELGSFLGRKKIERYLHRFNISKSKEAQINSIKRYNLSKYGVENVFSCNKIKEKIKQTNLEKYGCENPMQSIKIRKKAEATNKEKYGVKSATQNQKIKEKIKQTNLEKYGVNCSLQNPEIKKKSELTNLEKYGTIYSTQKEISKETLDILSSREKLKNFIEIQELRTIKHLSEKLDFCITGFRKYCHKYNLWDLIDHYTSSYELEIQELFPSIFTKTKKVLSPYEIDLYSEEHKFGIEFNGNYWHNEQHIEDFLYHQKKSLYAEEKGIFLYHIWEHEWLDSRKREIIISQIKNLLGLNEQRIFARKCELREINKLEAEVFMEENHLQGCTLDKVRFGLYYQDELVSAMTFGKPRFNKNYDWELIRFCNKKNTSVIGGASKLFKHFLKEYSKPAIISYAHVDKGSGNLYKKLGFKLSYISNPGYVWYHDNKNILSRYQCQKYKLIKQGFKGSSEKEIMQSRGFCRMFDCGNKIYSYD